MQSSQNEGGGGEFTDSVWASLITICYHWLRQNQIKIQWTRPDETCGLQLTLPEFFTTSFGPNVSRLSWFAHFCPTGSNSQPRSHHTLRVIRVPHWEPAGVSQHWWTPAVLLCHWKVTTRYLARDHRRLLQKMGLWDPPLSLKARRPRREQEMLHSVRLLWRLRQVSTDYGKVGSRLQKLVTWIG